MAGLCSSNSISGCSRKAALQGFRRKVEQWAPECPEQADPQPLGELLRNAGSRPQSQKLTQRPSDVMLHQLQDPLVKTMGKDFPHLGLNCIGPFPILETSVLVLHL